MTLEEALENINPEMLRLEIGAMGIVVVLPDGRVSSVCVGISHDTFIGPVFDLLRNTQ